MRGFRFRLRSLQRLREETRNMAKRNLANAIQQRNALVADEQDVQNEIQGLESQMRRSVAQPQVNIDAVLNGHRHRTSLAGKLSQIGKAIAQANEEVNRCRAKLVEADRDVKVLEKLHERQLAEHNRQIAAHEAKLLDEAAVIRASRNNEKP